MLDTNPLGLLAAFIIGVLAVGRATRLAVHDTWPPMLNLRVWWINLQEKRNEEARSRDQGLIRDSLYGWTNLLTCPFCFAPYAAAVNLTWALLAGLEWGPFWSSAWWVVNVWAAVTYLAAIVVVYDEPAED